PCLYLPPYPSIILTSPSHSLSYFHSFPISLQPPSTCFSSIPLQLLFLTLHLSTSVNFLFFFQTFPSSLSLLSLSIATLVHSSFLSSLFFTFFSPSFTLSSFLPSFCTSSLLSSLFFLFVLPSSTLLSFFYSSFLSSLLLPSSFFF